LGATSTEYVPDADSMYTDSLVVPVDVELSARPPPDVYT
jgi:hypothetical protein